ncbi:MAG: hypothetical protein ACKVLC_02150 [Phycisphaerales bacterium]
MRTPTVILFLLCALLTGCNSYNQVNVSVATPSGTPVAGASVHASPMYFFNPTNKNYIFIGPYDILEPFPAKGDAGVTDEFGNVQLHIVTKSPLDLHIYAENFDPWNGQISITEHGDAEVTRLTNQSKLDVSIVGSVQ